MPMSKKNKMMILFVSEENRLWGLVKNTPGRPLQSDIRAFIGHVSPSTLGSWKKGGTIDSSSEEKVRTSIKGRIETIKDRANRDSAHNLVENFFAEYQAESKHIYDVAGLLGISIEQSQRIIDEAIYSHFPLFSKFYSSTNTISQEFENYKGVYTCNMRRGAVWLQCAMRVRYIIEIRDGLALRCKLNVPKISMERSAATYWEYDGFVAYYGRNAFWTFEKRDLHKADFIHMITGLDRVFDERLGFVGTYLTLGQDDPPSIVTSDVYLERVIADQINELEHFMHTTPKILTGQVSESADGRWEGFRTAK